MLRKDTSPRGSTSGAPSQLSRNRSRSADAKSSVGVRVSRTTAIPIATLPNDIRCLAARYDMVLSNDCRRGLSVYTGGRHGAVAIRSAISGAANGQPHQAGATIGGPKTALGNATPRRVTRSGTMARLESDLPSSDYISQKHGVTVECMTLVASDRGALLWCGLSDGSVQVFRTASGAGANVTAFSQPPSPRETPRSSIVLDRTQQATRGSLLFTQRHHNGPVVCIVAGDNAVFTGGADWCVNRWNADEPFGLLGCVGRHSLAVRCLHATPRVLISGSDDGTVRLWPFTSLDRPCALEGHTASVLVVTTHRSVLWTAGEDATVRLWAFEGNRQCVKIITTHRAPVVALQPLDNLMVSFDKGGNGIVWDLKNAPNDVEALHCYQALGGVHPAVQTTAVTPSAAGGTSRSTSEGSAAFAPSTAAPSSRLRSPTGSATGAKTGAKTIPVTAVKTPNAIHDVRVVANVNGFIAWVFTATEGARLSFLPYRSIEEELEVKYGDLDAADEDDGMGESTSPTIAALSKDELRRQLEDHIQREERQQETLEEMQEAFAEFVDILGGDLGEVLTESMELFLTCQQRMTNLYCHSVALVHNQHLKAQSNLNKRTGELERQIDDLNTKLAEKARQLSQANAKHSQALSGKADEVTKLQLDLQRAANENRQLAYEVKAAKESNTTLEAMLKKHEARLERSAKGEVELAQLRSELKVTKDALANLQTEAGRQAEEAARQRARVMGNDAERSSLLQDVEKKLTEARQGELAAQAEARRLAADHRAACIRVDEVEHEAALLRQRIGLLTSGTDADGAATSQSAAAQQVIALDRKVEGLTRDLRKSQEENTALKAAAAAAAVTESTVASAASARSNSGNADAALVEELRRTIDELTAAANGSATDDTAVGESSVGALLRSKTETIGALRGELQEKNEQIATLQAKQREEAARLAAMQSAVDEMRKAMEKKAAKAGASTARSKRGGGEAAAPAAAAKTSPSEEQLRSASGGGDDHGPAVTSATALENELAEKTAVVTALTATVAELRSDIAERDATIAKLQAEVAQHKEAEIDALHGVARRKEQLTPRRDDWNPPTLEEIASAPSPTSRSAADNVHRSGHQQTPPSVRTLAAAPTVMTPMEKLRFDMDEKDYAEAPVETSRVGYANASVTSPAANFVATPASFVRSQGGHQNGLLALREAERLLGAHAISLSSTAVDLLDSNSDAQPISLRPARSSFASSGGASSAVNARFASKAPAPPLRRVSSRSPSPEIIAVVAQSPKGEDELGLLVNHLAAAQKRLCHLESSLARAGSPTLRDGILQEIGAIHNSLTAAGSAHLLAAASLGHESVLRSAQLRLTALERVREIQDAPMFGPGSHIVSPRPQHW
jgi:hypothetical protein